MADPLSITVSIVAILQLISEVIKFGLDFADVFKAILSLKNDVKFLRQLLKRLKARCDKALDG